jgi:hypothetical protein
LKPMELRIGDQSLVAAKYQSPGLHPALPALGLV